MSRVSVPLRILKRVRERIENEDWQGTCGCTAAWMKSSGENREKYCSCYREHLTLLKDVDRLERWIGD